MNRRERRRQEKQRGKTSKKRASSVGEDAVQAFAGAAQHLQAGRVQEGVALCNAILQADPGHGGALHLLGVAAHMAGDNEKAADLIGQAIAAGGADFSFHVNLGNALRALGRFDEARASYLTALQTAPGYAEIHNNLGAVLNDLGKPREAAGSCRRALEINNNYPEAHYNLGNALLALEEAEEAERCFRQAAKLKPDYHDAHFNLGHLLRESGQPDLAAECFRRCLEIDPQNAPQCADDYNHLGMSLYELGDPEAASGSYRRAIELDPDQVEAHNNLSKALKDLGDLDAAVDAGRQAAALRPGLAETHNTLGAALSELGEIDEAIVCFNKALDLDFNLAPAHLNLGNALRKQGRFDEALIRYRKALQINPKFAGLHEGFSCALLSDGNLEEGWKEFEWRHTLRSFGPFTDKVWYGEDLGGKTILVWPEQGIGDQIMFATCLPDIVEQAANCIIEIDRRLVSLFARSFPKAMVHGDYEFRGSHQVMRGGFKWLGDYPTVDLFCTIGSLPRYLRPTLDSFPGDGAFLKADPGRVDYWRQKTAALGPGRKIAVSWRSLLMNDKRGTKYPPLESWAPVFALADTVFINAQAGFSPEELDEIEERFGVRLHTFEELDLKDGLDDTAALLSVLDAVVSADTYLPMLAGALGLPAWRVTRSQKKQDWSFLGAEKYPWFSSLTVDFGETLEELRVVFQRFADDVVGISRTMEAAKRHHQAGRLEKAEELYAEALKAAPGRAAVHANLAVVLERSSRLDEARAAAGEALRLEPVNIAASLVLAKCERRAGAPQDALSRLQALPLGDLSPHERAQVSSEMGILCDRLGDFSRAYELFAEANRLKSQSRKAKEINGDVYLQEIAALEARFSPEWVKSWTDCGDCENTPVFVVGFPRSGTTLLGRILKGHPLVETLDERPLFKSVHERMSGYPDCLSSLAPEQINALRNDYFAAAREFSPKLEPRRILVDKMPFNLVEAGLIHRLFPSARFLLCLRHPADVCLSCFMQDFQANRALVHFDTLENSARLYARVMNLWRRFEKVLGLRVLCVRYEDLVGDPGPEIERVLDFLDLPRDAAVLDYGGAKDTSDIRAPSYHQVFEPIHGRAVGRWRNYREHMEPALPALAPFLDAFDYDAS